MAAVAAIRDQGVRSNAAGTMQGLPIWQILVRQGTIAEKDADAVMAGILGSFAKPKSDKDIFDAGWGGVQALLKATGAPAGTNPQDRMVDLLAGAANAEDVETQTQLVQDMIRVIEAQRLVSLKALGDLAAHLEAIGKGAKLDPAIVQRVSGRLSEIQLPRAGLSGVEKNALIFGYWSERHIENQRKLNLRAQVEKAGADPAKLGRCEGTAGAAVAGYAGGFELRPLHAAGRADSYTNPVFVRSHDFLGLQGASQTWRQTEVVGSGWPASCGGRGGLVERTTVRAGRSGAELPDFPDKEQALIWGDLVPQIMQSSKIQRFWNVSRCRRLGVGGDAPAAQRIDAGRIGHR